MTEAGELASKEAGFSPIRSRAARSLTELVTIIAGVLIALAVDAWYEGVEDTRHERTYLIQLADDLAETERSMIEADARNPVERHQRLLAAFQSDVRPHPDSTRAWLLGLGGYVNPVPITGVAEAMISTGDIRLIDQGVRTAVIRWLAQARDYELDQLYSREERFSVKHSELMALAGLPPRLEVAPLNSGFDFVRLPDGHDLDQIYGEARAYHLVVDLLGLKRAFSVYRTRQAAQARELRLQIEDYLSD